MLAFSLAQGDPVKDEKYSREKAATQIWSPSIIPFCEHEHFISTRRVALEAFETKLIDENELKIGMLFGGQLLGRTSIPITISHTNCDIEISCEGPDVTQNYNHD